MQDQEKGREGGGTDSDRLQEGRTGDQLGQVLEDLQQCLRQQGGERKRGRRHIIRARYFKKVSDFMFKF